MFFSITVTFKFYIYKEEKLNIISLGLIDKNLLQVFAVLPRKSCFLKNTKDFYGFEGRSIFVDSKTKTYKPNYKQKTSSLIMFFTFVILFVGLVALLVLLNTVASNVVPAVNILLVFLCLSSLVVANIMLPKHFFEVRNQVKTNKTFSIKEIN